MKHCNNIHKGVYPQALAYYYIVLVAIEEVPRLTRIYVVLSP